MTDEKCESYTIEGGGLLGYATDAECIAACFRRIGRLEGALREIARLAHRSGGVGQIARDILREPPQ
jgi:hypothetical protein